MNYLELLNQYEQDNAQPIKTSATEQEHGELLRIEFEAFYDVYIYADGFKEYLYIGD